MHYFPPYYGLRDYGVDGQFGQEESPEKFIDNLVNVFREVRRVLKDDGTLWVNIGDSYCGTGSKGEYKDPKYKDGRNGQVVSKTQNVENCKHKDLIGIPWMLAFALRKDGWYLRQDIIWAKKNVMPESVKDRCVKSHEYIFLLSKKPNYYFDYEAIQEEATSYDGRKDTMNKGSAKYADGLCYQKKHANTMSAKGNERWKWKNLEQKGLTTHTMHELRANGLPDEMYPVRNKRDVWSVATQPFNGAHFAVFPEKLIEPCIMAGTKEKDVILDPFGGSGTTGVVANRLWRHAILIDINPEYVELAKSRTNQIGLADVMV